MGDIFLNGIKYAGGVSNIFDPTIYSTTERKIGVWTDNKPLYQKTLVYTNQALSYGDTDLSLGISNMETVADSRAYITNSAHTTYRPLNTWTAGSASQVFYLIEPSTGTLRVHAEGSWPSPNIYITLQYTKTTDVAGSGSYTTEGVPAHHYSANETVVGTWTNGKTLYEKTVHINALPDSTQIGQYIDYPHGIADIDTICGFEGVLHFPNGNALGPVRVGFSVPAGFNYQITIDSYCTTSAVRIVVGADRSTVSADYTIRYTKTTD